MDKVVWSVLKLFVLIGFWTYLSQNGVSTSLKVLSSLAFILVYPYFVALVFGLKVMPAMDQACFISTSKAHVNYMSVNFAEGNFDHEAYVKLARTKYIKKHAKFRSKVVMKFGDLYYEELDVEEAAAMALYSEPNPKRHWKNQRDIEMFVEDNINIKMPLDGPQWRAWTQPYKDPEDGKEYLVIIWKAHHSLCDGVSAQAITGSMSNDFGPHMYIRFPEVGLLARMFLKLTAPFYMLLLVTNAFAKKDDNILTRGKKNMTGHICASTSKVHNVPAMKALCKSNGISINDLVMSMLSTTMHGYLGAKGDGETLSILLPANVRYKFYQTADEVKLENKFSALPLQVPMVANMKDAYS